MERLFVEALGNGVGGVSRPTGERVTFIRGALPGETVLCEPAECGGSWREAALVEIVSPSPDRVVPFCRLAGECGGCSLQHLSYPEQLRWKREWVATALRRAGLPSPTVDPVRPSPDTEGYRNRVTFGLEHGRLHLHRFRGDPLPACDCPLLLEPGRELARSLEGGAGPGPCRLTVRASFLDGGRALEFDGCPPPDPSVFPGVAIWSRPQGGGAWESPCGSPLLVERISGTELRVPAGGFFQINTGAASLMSGFVSELARRPGGGRVLDLYGGAGTFSIPLAASGIRALCVDSSAEAVRAAGVTADELGLSGRFEAVVRDVGSFLRHAPKIRGEFGSVIADPPRSGMGKGEASLLADLRSPILIMVSCNPFTLARDLAQLTDFYEIEGVTPFDLFPHTDHVETVCFLTRKPGKRG